MALISHGQADYRLLLEHLFPPGPFSFNRNPESQFSKLFNALAEELARVDGRMADLYAEADVYTCTELLPEWERLLLLDPTGKTTEERRSAIIGALLGQGGSCRDFFLALATEAGYSITIQHFRPYWTDSRDPIRAGDLCYGPEWAAVWEVLGSAAAFAALSELFEKIKPADSVIIWTEV